MRAGDANGDVVAGLGEAGGVYHNVVGAWRKALKAELAPAIGCDLPLDLLVRSVDRNRRAGNPGALGVLHFAQQRAG